MPELIDRHALLKKVYEHPKERERMTDGEWCRKCIYEAPKVEAEPARHGRWDCRHEDDWCYCSVCGTNAEGSDGECLETKYCPNYGAKMDGGADNG